MKSKTARDRKAAKDAKGAKGSQLKTNAQSMNIVCEICRTQFMCTSKAVALMQHAESKHPKNTVKECFPSLEES